MEGVGADELCRGVEKVEEGGQSDAVQRHKLDVNIDVTGFDVASRC